MKMQGFVLTLVFGVVTSIVSILALFVYHRCKQSHVEEIELQGGLDLEYTKLCEVHMVDFVYGLLRTWCIGGFRCNQNTVHLQCQACGGMMPSRNGFGVSQYCSGCDRAFCGAYWHALGIARNRTRLPLNHAEMITSRTLVCW
ncbi:E3 ubiquitin-protein ligase CHFR [Senna tora]|uniref:E3 ubiquitin-protein ligase CHFR n=1 Tax=Senna tora TaxID=362788 RepID=A0A834WAV1_9FABA|nr:E3 ubiquitin-protein ligase CHFR [Senna tora]